MASFARVSDINEVMEILVVDDNEILDADGNVSEEIGQQFLSAVLEGRYEDSDRWLMCCCEGGIRHKYPGIGWHYNEHYDAFIEPQPYKSWTFNEETLEWDPPVPVPTTLTEQDMLDGYMYKWNEYEQIWEIKRWFTPPAE